MSTYDTQDRYPVIVEETRRYVIWVEGDSQFDAVEQFNNDPRDPDRAAMYWFDWDATAPDQYEWEHIEDGGHNWRGTDADAHVRTHRNHLAAVKQRQDRQACAATGHPIPPDTSNGPWRWPDYCGTCGHIDPAARTAVATR
jgi:long-subunit acyl-CoA synthetase (AMP-forming)